MRAVQYERFGSSDVLDVVTLPDPVPADNQVLVAIGAATVMPADWKLRSGLLRQWIEVTFPKVPGRGGAGIVQSVGSKVAGLSPGARVLVSAAHHSQGTQASLMACLPDCVAKLPDDFPIERAAAVVRPGIAAWAGLISTGRIEAGMRVLIHGGAGGVGSIAIQLARNLGADVTATCSHRDGDYVADLGASTVIAYDREDFSRGTTRFDVIFDTVGGDVHVKSRSMLARGGQLVYLTAAPFPRDPSAPGTLVQVETAERRNGILKALAVELAAGRLRPSIFAIYDLNHVREAYDVVERKINRRGQVVLAMN